MNLERETIAALYSFKVAHAYLRLSQTPAMELLLLKTANGFYVLTIFAKVPIVVFDRIQNMPLSKIDKKKKKKKKDSKDSNAFFSVTSIWILDSSSMHLVFHFLNLPN